MTRGAARVLPALLAGALALACQTAPPAEWSPVPGDAAQVSERLAWLRSHVAARRSLRANARVSLSGAAGESFSKQLVLVERDAKLRIEVVGLLNQRVLVLASDGVEYDVYRAETGKIESGPVDAGVLWRVARIPLLPSEAVGLLLAAPALLDELPQAETNARGMLRLVWPDRSVTFDAQGSLTQARVLSPLNGEELAFARYADWRDAGGAPFPHRIELEFGSYRGSALLELREAELNPTLDPSWFRLKAAQSSRAPEEARP